MRDCHTRTKQGYVQQQAAAPAEARRPLHSRVFLGAVATAAAAFLALSGCTGTGTEAGPTPPPSSIVAGSAEPTTVAPSPTPTAGPSYQPATENGPAQNVPVPVMPETAKDFSKEGLIAFTEYWYATLGYAFETGDAEPMMAVSGPDCRTCEAMQKTVVAGHADGKWIVGGKMVLSGPASVTFNLMPDGTYQAIVMARQEQVKYFKANKELSKALEISKAQGDILVGVFDGNRWIAKTVEHLAGSKGP